MIGVNTFASCRTPKPPKLSLLEDVKKRVNYDCRVHPAMYMRKHRPTPNPFAICFSFRENDNYNHTEVKDILESQIGLKVRSVQYDPCRSAHRMRMWERGGSWRMLLRRSVNSRSAKDLKWMEIKSPSNCLMTSSVVSARRIFCTKRRRDKKGLPKEIK